MADASEMNSEECPVKVEISVEFLKREHQECLICVSDCVDSFDIQNTTTLLGVPLRNFLYKLTNINLSTGDNKYICKVCLNLVNELENAEYEYVKLKHSFELIISRNPLFNPTGKVLESALNTPRRDLPETLNNGEDKSSIFIKLEPMSDGDGDQSENGSKHDDPSDGDGESEVCSEHDNLNTQIKKETVSAKPRALDGASPRKLKTRKRKRKPSKKQTDSEKYECDICQRQFTQKGNYNRHLTTHSGLTPFECNTCQRRFTRKDHMATHMRTHTGEKPFECKFCLVKFNQKGSIINHMRTHTGQEPFECNICHRRFKQRPHLNSHLKMHSGEKPYECSFCKRCFSERSKLKIHLRTHTGEKPYECTYCNRQFNQSGNLQNHLRTHTGEKPYECLICQRKFNLKHHLRDHLITHTDARAYECSVCKQRFNLKHVMQKHLRTMHPVGSYPSFEASAEPEVIIKVNDNAEVDLKSEPNCERNEV